MLSPQAIQPVRRCAVPKITDNELMLEAFQSQEWQTVRNEAVALDMNEHDARALCSLLIHNLRQKDRALEIPSKTIKDVLIMCGLNTTAATTKIRTALLAARQLHDVDQNNNNYFRLCPHKGRLNNTHLSGVFVKPDGLNEILQGGQDQVSMRIRTFVGAIFRIVENQRDKALRFEQDHRDSEIERQQSSIALKQTIESTMPCGERSARARVRQFNVAEYSALGIVDKNVEGYTTALNTLATVSHQEGVTPRRGGVASNLTTVGKDAIRFMNSAVTQDLMARQADIASAATPAEKKRLMNHAMRERVTRMKRFNMFHADPNMVGVQNAHVDVADQANIYLNQEREKRDFEPMPAAGQPALQ